MSSKVKRSPGLPMLTPASTHALPPSATKDVAVAMKGSFVEVVRQRKVHCMDTRTSATGVMVFLWVSLAVIMTSLGWIYGFMDAYGIEDSCIAPVKVWAQVRSNARVCEPGSLYAM